MNKTAILAAAALLSAAGMQAQNKPFTLKGFANGFEGKYLYLGYGDPSNFKTDSCKVTDGNFSFKGELPGDVCYGCLTTNKQTINQFIDKQTYVQLEPGDLQVAINVFDPTHPVVYGSKHQLQDDELAALMKPESDVTRAVQKLSYESKDEAYKDRLEKFAEPFEKTIREKTAKYIKSHPDADNVLQQLSFMMGYISLDEARELYAALSPRLKESGQGKEIADEIATREKIEPGKLAPDFTAKDINGKKFTLSKLRGKYVVLDFWASWCGPCRASNPHMKELYEKYGKKGLDFVYVSDDDNTQQKWRDAVKKDGLEAFHHVLRGLKFIDRASYKLDKTNDISDKYAVHYLPTKYLIDPEGKMVGKFDTDELTEKLKEIYGF